MLKTEERGSREERRDVGADVQAAQGGAVEVMAVLKAERGHYTLTPSWDERQWEEGSRRCF